MIGILESAGASGLGSALLLAGSDATFWLPEGSSNFAGEVDRLFYLIFWLSVFFFVLILGMAAWFLAKYRRKEGEAPRPQKSSHHNTALELLWSVIPLMIVLGIFVTGFRGYMDLQTPPDGAYEIQVRGQKWSWSFTYPNGYEDSELHVPKGVPVKLVMSSSDVLHSFFVPAFRTKQDLVPGRYTSVWFEAQKAGETEIFCAEYCGTNHSQMLAKLVVHEPEDFDAWLTKVADWISTMPPDEAGALLYQKKGCVQCHSIDGTGGIGPTFAASFGNRRSFSDGSTGVMDENYIRESILNPRARMVAGFDPVMPTFQGRFKEDELVAIIAYIKSLSK